MFNFWDTKQDTHYPTVYKNKKVRHSIRHFEFTMIILWQAAFFHEQKKEIKLFLLRLTVFNKNNYKLWLVISIWKLNFLSNIFAFFSLYLLCRKRDISIKNIKALAAFWLAKEKMIERKMYLRENSFYWKKWKNF